ncbi:GNAT family N-acetyltransferase [Dethiosulfatarculus sandiegensis]|uniref:GNAT family N-acetyltransferase n=1 Tax=Dethiosulfatarculus sandiegensis TaxID=1429043 RepID=UPI0005CA7B00|nr:GNAT family N-acetyltransferase [Dethiosulfatarculus sandiegensis]
MSESTSVSPVVRPMTPADLDEIVSIDIKVLTRPRPEYWQMKLDIVEKHPQISALVAEIKGQVVGFIIGGASRWEYGVPENIGWIDTIGVDPDFQGQGIAKLLFANMTESLKENGVDTMYTFVTRRDWRLLKFFNSIGFQKGDMVNLEMEL